MVPAVSCAYCGATEDVDDDDGLPAGWSLNTSERGRGVERLCLTCTRTNIRAIEGKLPEEWWE